MLVMVRHFDKAQCTASLTTGKTPTSAKLRFPLDVGDSSTLRQGSVHRSAHPTQNTIIGEGIINYI